MLSIAPKKEWQNAHCFEQLGTEGSEQAAEVKDGAMLEVVETVQMRLAPYSSEEKIQFSFFNLWWSSGRSSSAGWREPKFNSDTRCREDEFDEWGVATVMVGVIRRIVHDQFCTLRARTKVEGQRGG